MQPGQRGTAALDRAVRRQHLLAVFGALADERSVDEALESPAIVIEWMRRSGLSTRENADALDVDGRDVLAAVRRRDRPTTRTCACWRCSPRVALNGRATSPPLWAGTAGGPARSSPSLAPTAGWPRRWRTAVRGASTLDLTQRSERALRYDSAALAAGLLGRFAVYLGLSPTEAVRLRPTVGQHGGAHFAVIEAASDGVPLLAFSFFAIDDWQARTTPPPSCGPRSMLSGCSIGPSSTPTSADWAGRARPPRSRSPGRRVVVVAGGAAVRRR